MAIKPDHVLTNKEKKSSYLADFTVQAGQKLKIKESEKNDKYQDLTGELKKLRNMKVTEIPFVAGFLE